MDAESTRRHFCKSADFAGRERLSANMTNRIENVRILTMEGPGLGEIPCGYLLYDDESGKILEVGACEGDGSGGLLLPGMIDGHTHLGMSEDAMGFEGDDTNETGEAILPQLRAIDAVNPMDRCFAEARAAGVTCVATGPGSADPIGGQFAILKTAGRRVDSMIVRAPASIKMALGENPKEMYHSKNQLPETRMATAALIRETLFKAKKYEKAMCDAHREPEDEDDELPDEPEYDSKLEALLPLLRREIPAHIHAHRADDIFTAIRIAKEFGLRYTMIHCTEGALIADELAEEGVEAFVGPLLCDRSKPELKNLSFDTPAVLAKAGVRFGLTTDHSVVPIQYLPLCAALAVKAGLPYENAIRAITIDPAEILGIADRVGSLRPGKDADFLLTDGDPLALTTSVRQVWINGRPLF